MLNSGGPMSLLLRVVYNVIKKGEYRAMRMRSHMLLTVSLGRIEGPQGLSPLQKRNDGEQGEL